MQTQSHSQVTARQAVFSMRIWKKESVSTGVRSTCSKLHTRSEDGGMGGDARGKRAWVSCVCAPDG